MGDFYIDITQVIYTRTDDSQTIVSVKHIIGGAYVAGLYGHYFTQFLLYTVFLALERLSEVAFGTRTI